LMISAYLDASNRLNRGRRLTQKKKMLSVRHSRRTLDTPAHYQHSPTPSRPRMSAVIATAIDQRFGIKGKTHVQEIIDRGYAAQICITVRLRTFRSATNWLTDHTLAWVVVQFAVAAVSGRRNLLNRKTAVRDRRYKESNCTTTLAWGPLTRVRACGIIASSSFSNDLGANCARHP
jgi:hypothetical protein